MQHHIVGFLQTLTPYSSILWVALIAPDGRAPRAINKFAFIAIAANLIQEDGASASTKVGITKRHYICWTYEGIWLQVMQVILFAYKWHQNPLQIFLVQYKFHTIKFLTLSGIV